MKPAIESAKLIAVLWEHRGGSRWQAADVLQTPGLSAAVQEATGPITPRRLGYLLSLLAQQGAPLERKRTTGQTFWRVLGAPEGDAVSGT